ncbi:MAG: hypothetical protein DMG73_14390 [Acidobacteria bacterium]|nr:MAG: hypothetical protein DMG73_14390 [Acidobacteriota bacterium]
MGAKPKLIDRQLGLARSFAGWIESSEKFELAAPQVLPIVTFRVKTSGMTAQQLATVHVAIVEEVTRDGQRWISETVANNQSVIRMMVISYLTGERHLLALEKALTSAAGASIPKSAPASQIRG